LTDAGARYLARTRAILTEIEEAEANARSERTVPTGRFVLTAPTMFGRLHVVPALNRYLERYPALRGELLLSDRWLNLVEDGIDLAVRIGFLDDSNLVVRKVGETRRVVVASPAYFAKQRAPRAPEEIAKHQVIQLSALQSPGEWRFARGNEVQHVGFTPRIVTNSADAAIAHALRGMGLTSVLAYQVADLVRRKKLRIVLAQHELPPAPIQIVYPATRLLSANVRAFVELVVDSCDWRFVAL
jgi:DNA-binding transcriptional LysR family regulator